MNKPILKDLDDLLKAGAINTESADKIREFYSDRSKGSHNRLVIIFSILGAILVGLGLILIVAHNWDNLSKPVKVFFAFLPLVVGQFFCGWSLMKRPGNMAWKEGSTIFLFTAIGSCLSLVSQIYNIQGNLAGFLLTWMLLSLPLIYIMNSSLASLLYIAGITFYYIESKQWFEIFAHHHSITYKYWWLLLLSLPHYYRLYKKQPDSNFFLVHNWFIPISLTIALSLISDKVADLIFIAFLSLFAVFFLFGTSNFFQHSKRNLNGFLITGSLGTNFILLMLSFKWYWEEIGTKSIYLGDILSEPEFVFSVGLTALALVFLYFQQSRFISEFHPIRIIFLVFIVLFFLGQSAIIFPVILVNLLILFSGIFTVWHGLKLGNFGILNYGLLTITALIICRFFDSDMSFVVRGLLFVMVGTGFFLANFLMLKKRKQNEVRGQ